MANKLKQPKLSRAKDSPLRQEPPRPFEEEQIRCRPLPHTVFPIIPPDHLDQPRPVLIDFLGGMRPLPPVPFPPIPFRPPKPLPLLTIRLQLIATTNQFPIDPLRFVPVIPGLNALFAAARITFVFDPVLDFLEVDDFQLDQDFELVDTGSLANPQNDPPAEDWSRFHAARQIMAKSHHGKLVVFVSNGTAKDFDSSLSSWILHDRGFHFSSTLADFVATSAYYWRPGVAAMPMDPNTLAHEIGHYFHLSHTMWQMPKTVTDAAVALRTAVENWGWNANDADKLFDADLPFIADTPPDPGPDLFASVNAGDACGGSNFVDVPVTFTNGTQRSYRLQPDRTNLMSYFKGCPGPHGFSVEQIRRMRVAIEHGNRQHLLIGRDTFVPAAPIAIYSGNGLGVAVLDHTQSPWYLQWTGPATAIVPRWIWLGGYIANIAAARDPSGVVHFAGRDYSGRVLYRTLPSQLWNVTPTWRSIGATAFAGDSVVIARDANQIELFVRASNGALHWHTVDPTGHTSVWHPLGGNCIGVPAVCSWDPNRIDVVARQADLTLAHNFWNGLQWSGWQTLGAMTGHDPVLVSISPGRLDLIVRDLNGHIQHRVFMNAQWSGNWEWLGGVFAGKPALVASGQNRFDVLARSADGALWHKEWNGSWWNPNAADWRPLGGRIAASANACASAIASGGRRLDIFARQADGGVLHASLDANNAQEPGTLSWSTLVCPAIV